MSGEVGGLRLIPAAGAAHARAWFAWRHEATMRRFNPVDDVDVDELTARLARAGADMSDETRTDFRWMVEREADGALVGLVGISGISWRMGYGELAYGIGQAFHGRGVGLASVRLLVERVFATSRLRRVWASIAAGNVASRRICERLGFTEEGALRQHFVIAGVPTDEVIYGLLREEWRRV